MKTEVEPIDATVELIYEQCRDGTTRQMASVDAIDAKAIQVFAAASVVLGLGTFTSGDLDALTGFLYGLAIVLYLLVACATFQIIRARQFRVVDGADRWWRSHRLVEPTYLREQLLDDLASSFAENRLLLDEKGRPLNCLLIATAIESALVATAVIASVV
jgi:hypothetical protein